MNARQRLSCFPPFRAMSVKVEQLDDDWRHARLRLPLNAFNRNPGGGMYGGAIANLADPIAALACNHVFPGHQLWTRSMQLDYRREGRSDLFLHFDFDPVVEQKIRDELSERGRATPVFEYGFYDKDDQLCVKVTNTVAIRPGDYRPRVKND